MHVRCVVCGKPIAASQHDEGGVGFYNADYLGFNDGVAGTISGGYGSRYDTWRFVIGICDSCVEDRLKSGKIILFA